MATAVAKDKYGVRFDVGMNGQRTEVPYQVFDALNNQEACTAILAVAPATIAGYSTTMGTFPVLPLTEIRMDELPTRNGETPNKTSWTGWAVYSVGGGITRKTGETSATFETGGGTQHITQAISHVSTSACNGATSTPNFKGAINVNGEGDVGGCDIQTPIFRLSMTMYKTKASVTPTYIANLYNLTGTVNDGSVTIQVEGQALTFLQHELLLEGASGGLRGNGDWEITLRLAGSPSIADVCASWDAAIKPASAVPKKGWEYAWVYFEEFYDETVSPPRRVKRPQTVNIERVYQEKGFGVLGLP